MAQFRDQFDKAQTPLSAANALKLQIGVHTQAWSSFLDTISASAGFNEAVDDRVDALIQDGTGITWSYSDGAGTLTPTVTITQYTDEMAQDAAATLIQNGTGITWSYNDGLNTLTPTVTITQYTDEMVDDRVAALIVNGNGIQWTYNDGAGTLTGVVDSASATVDGIVELATDAEAVTGTDTARAVTPANLTARLAAPGTIGGTTPAAGTFTTLTANGNTTLGDASGDSVTQNAKIYTKPNAPIVAAFNSATVTDASGDGTVVTPVNFDGEQFDRGSDFATDTFTFPATGPYFCTGAMVLTNLTVGTHIVFIEIVTSNRTYTAVNQIASRTLQLFNWSFDCIDADAADTGFIRLTVSGGTKVVDIFGDATGTTRVTWRMVG